jgi:50S ribosomal protein L16 3-hydroxylase
MVSFATDGGGVGPHVDSYDVFLLQAQGRRRWRYGRQEDLSLRGGLPLKILAHFEPEFDEVLEPGDMLYLPPGYAHDGVAQGECQTYSIGFRAPARGELAQDLLQRLADDARDVAGGVLFSDAGAQPAKTPAEIPAALVDFARDALQRVLAEDDAFARALGESLTEPKANVVFAGTRAPRRLRAVRLDARTRMMHDARHIFVNGDSWRAGGADARLLRKLANGRRLDARDLAGASADALALLRTWCGTGWAHATEDDHGQQ